jgi:hypothetical protein
MHQPGWKLRSSSQRMTWLGEADVRFDPHMGDQSALHVRIDRLAVNLQHASKSLAVNISGRASKLASIGALWSMAILVRTDVVGRVLR